MVLVIIEAPIVLRVLLFLCTTTVDDIKPALPIIRNIA